MSGDIEERFHQCRTGRPRQSHLRANVWLIPSKLNTLIREYYEGQLPVGGPWLSRPEVPSSEELMDTDTVGGPGSASDTVELNINREIGPFDSKESYLRTHYELLREDTIRPIREGVLKVRNNPGATEDAFGSNLGIYDKVHICAVVPSTRGIAVHVTFSLYRTGKKIIWEQSKRLVSGSLVVLTPKDDMFRTKAVVATVAARPLENLVQNPPEIDLFFARADELEIDPAAEFVMIEERNAYFEANRHTLEALKHMMKERFPLSEHLVDVTRAVSAPPYLLDNPNKDLRSVLKDNKHETFEDVDVLKGWPHMPQSNLDDSQLRALRSILTKCLAIIEGPPGTGKTFLSVQAVKVLLANHRQNDPPIIIACQTNHAVDQILRHIAEFEEKFVRLGGRSKDRDVIKKRTLFEVRQETSENRLPGGYANMASKKMKDVEREIAVLLTPLASDKKPLNHRFLESCGLLTKKQADSLESGASRWVQDKKTHVSEARMPFTTWLGDKLVPVPPKQLPENFAFDYEEEDLELEQLKDMEAENTAKDDEDFDKLSGGPPIHLADNFTCRNVPGMDVNAKVRDLLKKEQDVWRIPEARRPAVYRYLQAEQKACILSAFRDKAREYNKLALKRKIGYWEKDENILKQQRVIGMTTTGLSKVSFELQINQTELTFKYRALISALQPKVVLIEEAAETLEAPVAVACISSLQQLILVGDHRQLRPHVNVSDHAGKPFSLDVSLFERMVNNGVQYDILATQRRMIPEIRRLLYPIYKNTIKDHPSVLDRRHRPDVPGMGGVNSLFFTHQWAEQRDDLMSFYNPREASMIVGFFNHLLYNGMDVSEITILVFYNGQRKHILAELRARIPAPEAKKLKVVTVDSYQGEENTVVILSLARSNEKKSIGFLSVINRVCVALSRAQCGFYMFGNGELLFNTSKTWQSVLMIVAGQKNTKEAPPFKRNRLCGLFPIHCPNHNRRLELADPDEWDGLVGGCNAQCGGALRCGHSCGLNCHPFSHDEVHCQKCFPKQTAPELTEPESKSFIPHSRSVKSNTDNLPRKKWNETYKAQGVTMEIVTEKPEDLVDLS